MLQEESQTVICVPQEFGTVDFVEALRPGDDILLAANIKKKVKSVMHARLRSKGNEFSIFVFHMPGGLDDVQWTSLAGHFFERCLSRCWGRPSILTGDFDSGGTHLFFDAFPSSSYVSALANHQHDHVVGINSASIKTRDERWVAKNDWALTDHPFVTSTVEVWGAFAALGVNVSVVKKMTPTPVIKNLLKSFI